MSLCAINVNRATDLSLGLCSHTLWSSVVPAPVPNTPTVSFEMIMPQQWLPGQAMGANQLSTTVRHMGQPVCLDGHDIGPLIPDITIPPANFYLPLTWLFSSRKFVFSASTVKYNGKPVALSGFGPAPVPMLTCGDPLALPSALPITNFLNPNKVGLTPFDLFMGIVQIAVSVAIDLVFMAIGNELSASGKAAEKLAREVGERAAREGSEVIARQLARTVGTDVALRVGKLVVGMLAGAGLSTLAEGNPTAAASGDPALTAPGARLDTVAAIDVGARNPVERFGMPQQPGTDGVPACDPFALPA